MKINSLALLLFRFVPALAQASYETMFINFDSNTLNVPGIRKRCRNTNSDVVITVDLTCAYTNKSGAVTSCIDTRAQRLDDNSVFLSFEQFYYDQCQTQGTNGGSLVPATIKFQACNHSPHTIRPVDNNTYIHFRKENNLPIGEEWERDLAEGQCVSYEHTENIDLCRERRVVDIMYTGNLVGQPQPNYGQCYLYTESWIRYTCDPNDIIITELAFPTDSPNGKYIELRFSQYCGGVTITEDTIVKRTRPNGSSVQMNLKDQVIPDDFFIIICESADGNNLYGGKCDMINNEVPDFEFPQIISVEKSNNGNNNIIDVCGVSQDGPDFTGGRIVRLTDPLTIRPAPTFVPSDWVVIVPIGYNDMDPGVWVDPPCKYFFTEVVSSITGYIEIKSNCSPGHSIGNVRVDGTSDGIIQLPAVMPDDGFIIICHNGSETVHNDIICDVTVNTDQPLVGITTLEIKNGVVTDDAFEPGQNFSGKRAVRYVNSSPIPTSTYISDQWLIIDNMAGDPRVWTDVLFFTEFADPSDGETYRYIELYAPGLQNHMFNDNFKIEAGGMNRNLGGLRTDENGFLVLCAQPLSDYVCAETSSAIANVPGSSMFFLKYCYQQVCTVIDRYGRDGTAHNYTNGRAARYTNANPTPTADFDLDHWFISTDNTSVQCDPGVWDDGNNFINPGPANPGPANPGPSPQTPPPATAPVPATPPAPPATPPAPPAPSKGKSKAKGKSAGKRGLRRGAKF